MKLKDVEVFLFDMDGTIYLQDEVFDGAPDLIRFLEGSGKEVFFLTNNSSKNHKDYEKKLSMMGIPHKENIFTSGTATAMYLKEKGYKRVFLLGTKALQEDIEEGLLVTEENPDVVMVGFDTTLTYDKLWKACDFLLEGVDYVATHPDFNCPLKGGKQMPDAGAIIAFIEASTKRKPKVIGKPETLIVEYLRKRFNLKEKPMAMVGDRLYTDMELAKKAGLFSILVLTGETKREDVKDADVDLLLERATDLITLL